VFGPDKHFLSKNPVSSSKINSIYETFPDAKIICMVRHPFEAVPSAISWISYGIYQFNSAEQPIVTEMILSWISHFYTYPLEQLDKQPEERRLIETYDTLVADPKTCVTGIYKRFGYNVSESFQQYLEVQTEKSKNYQSRHSYSLDQYALPPDRIIEDFKPIFHRFEFSMDG
jgi:hypothetical protein